jgi:uncharacterized protein (TIGR03435 family)
MWTPIEYHQGFGGTMKTSVKVAVILLIFQLAPSAQLEFDVASVKENKTLTSGTKMRLMPGGGVAAEHLPARSLITIAYSLQPYQFAGAPDWASDTYYDINAKPAGTATREQTFTMLQALLVDRFRLTFHRETRDVDGFALVQARPGTLGPNLRRSAVDCENREIFSATPRCKEGGINMSPAGTSIKAVGTQMWTLLQTVIGQMGAPVSDDTQLSGPFDFDIQWSNDVGAANDLPSISTALQEQLGLKLEKRRVSAEMFVVDRFERPTPD